MRRKFCVLFVIANIIAGSTQALAAWQDWKLLFSLQVDQAAGPLAHPTGLYADAQAERYYVTDSGHNRLVSFDRSGKLLHAFTAGGALDKPIAMSKKADGRLLVLEKGKASLTEIDVKTRAVVTHVLQDKGRQIFPQRLKGGSDGRFYVIDKASGAIVILDQGLAVSGRLQCPGCQGGYTDFSVKGSEVYALPALGSEVHVFDSSAALIRKISLLPAPEFPVSLALAADGAMFVLERHAGTVARYLADGHLLARSLGPGQKEGYLSYPAEIQVDPWGLVCVVDEGNGRISVFQP